MRVLANQLEPPPFSPAPPPPPPPRTQPPALALPWELAHTERPGLVFPYYFSEWFYFHGLFDVCKMINTVQINKVREITSEPETHTAM